MIKNKYLLLVIYSFLLTLLLNILGTLANAIDFYDLRHFFSVIFSSFLLVIGLLYLSFKFFQKQQKIHSVNISNFLGARITFFICFVLIGLVFPISESLNLADLFTECTLIDDEEYYDDPRAEYAPSPFGSGTDASGYYSNFKYYVDANVPLENLELREGVIEYSENFGYFITNEYNEDIPINAGNCTSKEVAYLRGYKPIVTSSADISHFLLPFNYLFDVLLRDGLYTLLFALVVVLYAKAYPHRIFSNLDDESTPQANNDNLAEHIIENDEKVKIQTIVQNYGKSLAQGVNGIARPISLLQNSKDEIQQAIKDYIIYLRGDNKLTDDLYGELSTAYSVIDHFIDDDRADIINKVFFQLKSHDNVPSSDLEVYYDFMDNSFTNCTERMIELDELIKK